ncbi:MAG: hypothetical protein J6K58_14950, partial [Lachnospiraceae bacterium]|nr:hypothetical protein [Lachnospiraceae bacterium]
TAMDGCFSLRAAWMPLEDDSSVILTSIHSVRKIRFPAPLLKIPYTLPSTSPSCLPCLWLHQKRLQPMAEALK